MSKLAIVLVLAALGGALTLATARDASATVPTWTNPCSADIDVAACERLTFLAEQSDEQTTDLQYLTELLESDSPIIENTDAANTKLDNVDSDLQSIYGWLQAGPTPVTCVDDTCTGGGGGGAALTSDEHDALNLAWWGVWALVGLAFVSLIAAPWYRAWNIEGKLGRG